MKVHNVYVYLLNCKYLCLFYRQSVSVIAITIGWYQNQESSCIEISYFKF